MCFQQLLVSLITILEDTHDESIKLGDILFPKGTDIKRNKECTVCYGQEAESTARDDINDVGVLAQSI